MWFLFALITLLCWSFSDLFSKIGCSNEGDKYSHLKMLTAIGFVMGTHALYEIFINGVEISADIIFAYMPVSVLYILSMTIGYLGLRYIELSISSPICNSSGALVAVYGFFAYGLGDKPAVSLLPVILVCTGVIGIGFSEMTEDEERRIERQSAANRFYPKNIVAIIIPVVYCILDALGTIADNIVLEYIDENSANVAYELTFLACGIFSLFYVTVIKKQKYILRNEGPKYLGGIFETAGQFFYIFAIADREHMIYSAPIISSYCVLSVVWGRVFLKEKLSKKHYISILLAAVGILILGGMDI